jgi:hypothetical protein
MTTFSATLTNLTALLPQQRCSNYVSRWILAPSPLWLQKHTDQRTHDMQWCCWVRHCATNRKITGLIPEGVIGIFHYLILPAALCPWSIYIYIFIYLFMFNAYIGMEFKFQMSVETNSNSCYQRRQWRRLPRATTFLTINSVATACI